MPLIDAEADAVVDFETARLVQLSIHTADPGTTGASEAAGVTRVALAWPGSSGGTDAGTEVDVAVPAGGPYTHFGIWDGATFRGGNALSSAETYAAAGTLKVTIGLTANPT